MTTNDPGPLRRSQWPGATVFFAALLGLFPGRPLARFEASADEKPMSRSPAAKSEPAERKWHTSLAPAIDEARQRKLPILVRAGATWCTWCRRMDPEIADPAVQAELGKWVVVSLDVDTEAEEAQRLGIGTIPAFRVLDSSGRSVRSTEGYMTAARLVGWLQGKETPDDAPLLEEVTEIPELGRETLAKLVELLRHRDAGVREAVIRKLAQDRKLAAAAVVEGFVKGNLVTRLALLELLSQWQAPIAELDPWQPHTISSERLSALEDWADSLAMSTEPDASKTPEISPEDLDGARLEMDRMAGADPIEAEAITARLARFKEALLPEVRARRAKAEQDAIRERLDALRFRLVSSDALALKWPGGLARLASTEAAKRQQAASELSGVVAAGDESLLIELFSHPDPLVRELSLKALHQAGGEKATSELARLLADPEPNVRAAVLKQMTDKPTIEQAKQIIEYVQKETDPDLIVHAIRMLKEVKNAKAVECLIGLLKHGSWQVRAEAVEAIGASVTGSHRVSGGRAADLTPEKIAEAYGQIIDVLDDEDGFVVGQAVIALRNSNLAAAAEPLGETAKTHPELASSIAETLLEGDNLKPKAVPLLRRWLSAEQPQLRAAALKGLRREGRLDGEKEILPALSDPDETVRIAAAEQWLAEASSKRPSPIEHDTSIDSTAGSPSASPFGSVLKFLGLGGAVAPPKPAAPDSPPKPNSEPEAAPPAADEPKTPPPPQIDAWLTAFRAGKSYRPEWFTRSREPLQKMFASESTAERIPAGVALVALGEDAAIPELLEIATKEPAQALSVARVLAWVPWSARPDAFRTLRGLVGSDEARMELCEQLTALSDPRSASLLWEMLTDPAPSAELALAVTRSLLKLHGRELAVYYPDQSDADPPTALRRGSLSAQLSGSHVWQTRVALAILLQLDSEEALAAAREIAEDPARPAKLREDAFSLSLLCLEPKEATEAAAKVIIESQPGRARAALAYLTLGHSALQTWEDGHFRLPVIRADENEFMSSSRTPKAEPPLPAELKPEHLVDLSGDPDQDVAAQALYLRAILGDDVDLGPLIARWRKAGTPDYRSPRWDKLVYEAIAARNDSQHVPVLEELYKSLSEERGSGNVRDLYWAIRSMTGPEVLALRKKIRSEVGMQNLQ